MAEAVVFAISRRSKGLVEEKDLGPIAHWKPRKSFFRHVVDLAGHCLASAGLFLFIFLLAWLIRFAVLWLDNVQPYPLFTKDVIDHVEDALVCLDVVVCGGMTLYFFFTFFREILSE